MRRSISVPILYLLKTPRRLRDVKRCWCVGISFDTDALICHPCRGNTNASKWSQNSQPNQDRQSPETCFCSRTRLAIKIANPFRVNSFAVHRNQTCHEHKNTPIESKTMWQHARLRLFSKKHWRYNYKLGTQIQLQLQPLETWLTSLAQNYSWTCNLSKHDSTNSAPNFIWACNFSNKALRPGREIQVCKLFRNEMLRLQVRHKHPFGIASSRKMTHELGKTMHLNLQHLVPKPAQSSYTQIYPDLVLNLAFKACMEFRINFDVFFRTKATAKSRTLNFLRWHHRSPGLTSFPVDLGLELRFS